MSVVNEQEENMTEQTWAEENIPSDVWRVEKSIEPMCDE
jgi:hypothetical protein